MSGGNGGVPCRPWIGRVREGKARPLAAAGVPRDQRVCGEPPESARIPRKRPRPEGMAAGRRRLAAPQAMTFTARGWGSPRRPAIFAHHVYEYLDLTVSEGLVIVLFKHGSS